MTYTEKRIVIEAEVPEGATHYEALINRDGDTCIDWYKQEPSRGFLWEGMREEWIDAYPGACINPTVKPIEVIE